MRGIISRTVPGLCLLLAAAPVAAQQKPKVPEPQARATALAKVPHGHVRSEELEHEGGRLIYSYDIAVPGRSGIQEVNVDAMTGAVVGVQHEGPAAERSEAARESTPRTAQARPSAPYAQWLVDRAVAGHAAVRSVEIAIVRGGACRTVAATAPEDVGEKCDADENGPMRTGRPDVEAPSKADPVYDITQPLHDASGTLIGAVGMDIAPAGLARPDALSLAYRVRRQIEKRIGSKSRLFGPAPKP